MQLWFNRFRQEETKKLSYETASARGDSNYSILNENTDMYIIFTMINVI